MALQPGTELLNKSTSLELTKWNVYRLHSLKAKPEWNGELVQLLSCEPTKSANNASNRYPIRLLTSDICVSIKIDNLGAMIAATTPERKSVKDRSNANHITKNIIEYLMSPKLSIDNIANNDSKTDDDGDNDDKCDNLLHSLNRTFHSTLPKLVSQITASNLINAQSQLNSIANHFTALQQLTIANIDNQSCDLTRIQFPNLRVLNLCNIRLVNIHFDTNNTPRLEQLSIERVTVPSTKSNRLFGFHFYLSLPKLIILKLRFLPINFESNLEFGDSLSRCVNLTEVYCTESGHLTNKINRNNNSNNTQFLICPLMEILMISECNHFISNLKIWAPQLSDLNLRQCNTIKNIRLLNRLPKQYISQNKCVDFQQCYNELSASSTLEGYFDRETSDIFVNLVDTAQHLSESSLSHFENHERIGVLWDGSSAEGW